MSPDGTALLDEGVTVYQGPVAEGTKIHKWNGLYYLSIPEGGVGEGWQTVLRSKSIYGPYERRIVLETGMTDINGPHQGSIVDTPDGQWWFFHFQRTQTLGRVVHLQPMHWDDGWPVIGVDIDRNGVGEPVLCWRMPFDGTIPSKPASSDNFDSPELGTQWQFNHNPVDGAWSLTEKAGSLSIHAIRADSFRKARNTLTQKLMGYSGTISVRMDVSAMEDGQRCGLAVMSDKNHLLGVCRTDGKKQLYFESAGTVTDSVIFRGKNIILRLVFDVNADDFHFEYSNDGKTFSTFGQSFKPRFGFWKGARPALFCYNVDGDSGLVRFDEFEVD